MNLIKEPWIPILGQNGQTKLVSLATVFQDGKQISDLAVNPPQRIALMRLLICITQTALDGPSDEEDWYHCKNKIVDAVLIYLKKWQESFYLYGKRPFLQAADIEPLGNATLDKLGFNLAAGNNSVLFDHQANPLGRGHTSAWCTNMLLTFQCFSRCGLIGTTTWGKRTTTKTSEHSPAIEGSALHTFIRGKNLLETVWMNLLTKEMIENLPGMTFGKPVWERADVLQGILSESDSFTGSYLGRLVPFSRAILLNKNKQTFTLSNGLVYPKLPAQRDTSATVVRRGKGNKEKDQYIAVNLSRHPWRELAAILSLKAATVAGGALALKHLHYIKSERVDIWTGGMAADKNKILDVGEWNFSVPVKLLNSSELLKYEKGVQRARTGEFKLKNAVKAWHTNMSVKPVPYGTAQTYYWSELDRQYDVLEDSINKELSLNDRWYLTIRRAMDSAFNHACAHTTSRQIQAFAIGSQQLRLKKFEE